MLNKICWQSNSWCCNCSSLVNSFALAFSDGVSVAKLWSSHGRPTLICFIALTRLVGSEFGSPFIKNGGFWFTYPISQYLFLVTTSFFLGKGTETLIKLGISSAYNQIPGRTATPDTLSILSSPRYWLPIVKVWTRLR